VTPSPPNPASSSLPAVPYLDAPVSSCPFSEPRMPSDGTFIYDRHLNEMHYVCDCDAWKALKSVFGQGSDGELTTPRTP